MKMVKLMAASAAVCVLALGAPAMSQQAQNNDVDNTSGSAVVVNDLLDVYLQAQTTNDNSVTTGDIASNNSTVPATQTLLAINANSGMNALVDQTRLIGASDQISGDNRVQGSSFAAYAGILNQAWNTGINSNAQAGSNISAMGTVNFGDSGAGQSGGNGSGN